MGNIQIVKECIESILPLPPSWNLYVYDSDLSEIDGTKAYLIEKQKEYGFVLLDEKERLQHGPAVSKLVSISSSPWILHIDSDAKLLDRNFFSLAEQMVLGHKFTVWGRVCSFPGLPDIENEFRIVLPRTYSWNVMFERKFMQDNGLSFSPKRVEKDIKVNEKNERYLVWGDTSWELYWESARKDLFGRYPDNLWKCWEHKDHSTVNWKTKNRDAIQKFDKLKRVINIDNTVKI